MDIEEIEKHDWDILPHMDDQERYEKSISAYWLDRWYDKVADLTFETQFYKELPDKLPWPSMVRWENKSPKDSEYWGPVNTRKEAERLFYTSLRCKKNQGTIYCIRKWTKLGEEFRCFWNGGIVAISSDTKPPSALLTYLVSIAHRIPYYRCVVDIAEYNNEFILVEFNSWETNSGAHQFMWTEELLYQYDEPFTICCRWIKEHTSNNVITDGLFEDNSWRWPLPSTLPKINPIDDITIDKVQILLPSNQPNTWLVKDDILYIINDVWLTSIDLHTFKPIRWRRGPFRFSKLTFWNNQLGIRADNNNYWLDLTPCLSNSLIDTTCDKISNNNIINYPEPPYRYGFVGKYNNQFVFARFLYDGKFIIIPY